MVYVLLWLILLALWPMAGIIVGVAAGLLWYGLRR